MTERRYFQGDKRCTLREMVRDCPDWAAARIRAGEEALEQRDDLIAMINDLLHGTQINCHTPPARDDDGLLFGGFVGEHYEADVRRTIQNKAIRLALAAEKYSHGPA